MRYYSPGSNSFYDDQINVTIPPDSVSLLDSYYVELLNGMSSGKKLTADSNGNPIYDSKGHQVINVDKNDYTDITAFSLDNVVPGEEIKIIQFNKKVVNDDDDGIDLEELRAQLD